MEKAGTLQQNKSDKSKNGAVVVSEDEKLPDVSRLTPERLDYLENVIHALHLHQFRHVEKVKIVQLTLWTLLCLSSVFVNKIFVKGLKVSDSLAQTLGVAFLIVFLVGGMSIFSKCLSGLYNFRAILHRTAQVLFFIFIFGMFKPYLLYFENFIPAFDSAIFILSYVLGVACLGYLAQAFIPYKWLKKTNRSLLCIFLFVGAAMFTFEPTRHLLLNENQVYVYSDFGIEQAEEIGAVGDMIDSITE